MRKSEISRILIGLFLLLSGCSEKKPEIKSDKIKQLEIKHDQVLEPTQHDKENIEPTHPDFDLKEIPVAPPNVDVPNHIAEVNLDIQKITAESANPARKIWDKYFQVVIAKKNANLAVPDEVVWDRLTQKNKAERLPTFFYNTKKGESVEMNSGLYGLYLAVFMSASEGGGDLVEFIKQRASDSTIRNIDINLFKIFVSGILDAEVQLNKMSFNNWSEISKSANPVYRMLAIQIGDLLFEEGGIASENLSQSRLKYYKAFLNDDSQKLRIEALKGIRNLGNELALPVFDAYLKSEYGETDRIEVERVFKK